MTAVAGAGIPDGTIVTAINGTVLTLDHSVTTVASGAALSFGGNTITGGTSIVGGTLVVNSIGGAAGGQLNGVAGGVLNLSSGSLNYVGAVGTGNGETTAKVINLMDALRKSIADGGQKSVAVKKPSQSAASEKGIELVKPPKATKKRKSA